MRRSDAVRPNACLALRNIQGQSSVLQHVEVLLGVSKPCAQIGRIAIYWSAVGITVKLHRLRALAEMSSGRLDQEEVRCTGSGVRLSLSKSDHKSQLGPERGKFIAGRRYFCLLRNVLSIRNDEGMRSDSKIRRRRALIKHSRLVPLLSVDKHRLTLLPVLVSPLVCLTDNSE